MDLQSVSNIFIYGLWKGVWLLKDHSHFSAQLLDAHLLVVDLLAIDKDLTFFPETVDIVIHAVQRAQESGLAASGRTDERGYRILLDAHVDILQNMIVPVVDVDIFSFNRFHLQWLTTW